MSNNKVIDPIKPHSNKHLSLDQPRTDQSESRFWFWWCFCVRVSFEMFKRYFASSQSHLCSVRPNNQFPLFGTLFFLFPLKLFTLWQRPEAASGLSGVNFPCSDSTGGVTLDYDEDEHTRTSWKHNQSFRSGTFQKRVLWEARLCYMCVRDEVQPWSKSIVCVLMTCGWHTQMNVIKNTLNTESKRRDTVERTADPLQLALYAAASFAVSECDWMCFEPFRGH